MSGEQAKPTLCLYDAIGAAVVVDGPDGRRRLHVGRAWFARSWGRWVYVCPGPGPDQTSTTTVTVPSTIAALDARAAQAKGCWS